MASKGHFGTGEAVSTETTDTVGNDGASGTVRGLTAEGRQHVM
jgi:hypothetical protein